jgi:CheY-like chemotaxis protein
VKRRILVVDDDPFIVEASSILLELQGHECRVATSGRDAIDLARRFAPDIVILDLHMSGMNGFEVARALRADGHRRLHLAAVTGFDDASAVARAREAGFDQHVVKPIDAAVLKRIVDEAERVTLSA